MNFLPRTRGGVLWRALLASFLVIAFSAGAVATAGLLKVKDIADAISPGATADIHITLPKPGQPETLLLVGSDHRAGESFTASNTDTMMLVRLDDGSETINAISIPRDLEVSGAGGGAVKLNSIYSQPGHNGGDNGLLKVLETQVFPGLKVNHVIDMNFLGFSDLVDAIGCVYAPVDHRYYNESEPAPSPNNYSSINIEPGYQRLCGDHLATNGALPFVRFRHTDSDKVRNARQQDFIRWARDDYTASDLIHDEGKLVKIFGQHVTTDKSLASIDGLLDLFNLVVNAQNSNLSLRTIPFPENFGNCAAGGETPCYVYPCVTYSTCVGETNTAPPLGVATLAEKEAYHSFITPVVAKAATTTTTQTSTGPKVDTVPHHLSTKPTHGGVSLAGLNADVGDGKSQAAQVGNVHFPVYYPKYIPASSEYCFSLTDNCVGPSEPSSAYAKSYPRGYLITAPNHTRYQSYVMTLVVNAALGEYFTVQGTTWQDPPLLRSPDKIVTVDGRKLEEYVDGSHLAEVAFHTSHGWYWVNNTLSNDLPNSEMLAVAATMVPAA